MDCGITKVLFTRKHTLHLFLILKILIHFMYSRRSVSSKRSGSIRGDWIVAVITISWSNFLNLKLISFKLFIRWGQHIVLLLNGYRQTVRHSLFIDFSANKTANQWQGRALIPFDIVPPLVTKMNAYAIHGVGDSNRVYESLYPVAFNSTNGPDLYFYLFFDGRTEFLLSFVFI